MLLNYGWWSDNLSVRISVFEDNIQNILPINVPLALIGLVSKVIRNKKHDKLQHQKVANNTSFHNI